MAGGSRFTNGVFMPEGTSKVAIGIVAFRHADMLAARGLESHLVDDSRWLARATVAAFECFVRNTAMIEKLHLGHAPERRHECNPNLAGWILLPTRAPTRACHGSSGSWGYRTNVQQPAAGARAGGAPGRG